MLTPDEEAIFGFLLEVQRARRLRTTLRAAGGWVRDKLMGKESDDIDVSLDQMTGAGFVDEAIQYGNDYLARTGKPHPALGHSYKIRANPEKSKHLETVALEVHGQKIDFINLREEKYDPASRIPVMTMATGPDAARKDAERRDLTINSLFYNLNTGQVEDFVGGLDDLRTMTLRTPLDPEKTFKDDPLRMLRVLRFHSLYPGSKIDPAIIKAMRDPNVQDMFSEINPPPGRAPRFKVAPERAWPELRKMMGGPQAVDSLRVMFDTGLYRAVFNTPSFRRLADLTMDQRNAAHKLNLIDHTLDVVSSYDKLLKEEGADEETRGIALFAALFHDLGKAFPGVAKEHPKRPGQFQYMGHEDKSVEIADEALRAMGMGRRARSMVSQLIRSHMDPHSWEEAPKGFKPIPGYHDPKELSGYYGKLHEYLESFQPIVRGTDPSGESLGRSYERGELARLGMLHSMADALSKGTGEVPPDFAHKREHMRNLSAYYDYWASQRPMLDGNEVIALFPELDPTRRVKGEEGKSESFVSELQGRLRRWQAIGRIRDKQDAIGLISGMRDHILNKYKAPEGEKLRTAWVVRNCKFAQAQVGYSTHGHWAPLSEIREIELKERGNEWFDDSRLDPSSPAIWVCLDSKDCLFYSFSPEFRDLDPSVEVRFPKYPERQREWDEFREAWNNPLENVRVVSLVGAIPVLEDGDGGTLFVRPLK